MRITLTLATVALLLMAGADAQAQQPETGADVRLAPGIMYQDGMFGDDSPKRSNGIGATVSVTVRGQTTRRTGFSFEAALQPFGIQNPHFDEALHTLYFVIGPEIGRRTYVRPVGGVAVQAWSGSQTESGMNLALAFGVAIGHRWQVSRGSIGVELAAKTSCSPGACSALLGVQIPIDMW